MWAVEALVDAAEAPGHAGYRHQAVLYRGEDGFVDALVPFLEEGLDNGEPTLVAVPGERKLQLLRDALGRRQAGQIRFLDMEELGRNPAHIIPTWVDFVAAHAGVPVRGIGEPIWAGRRPQELAECQLHEALLNAVVDPDTPFRLQCPYDELTLDATVIAEAHRTHEHADGEGHLRRLFHDDLPPAPDDAIALAFTADDLRPVREAVRQRAIAADIAYDHTDDLVLAVHEIATNSVIHGGGRGRVRIWATADAFVVEVRDAGHLADPLAGRLPPDLARVGGRGLWLAHRMCDLVQVRSNGRGTTVRISTWR